MRNGFIIVKKSLFGKKYQPGLKPNWYKNLSYFFLMIFPISPKTSGIRDRIRTGIHSHVRDTTSKSSVRNGTYITTNSSENDKSTALIRLGFVAKPNSLRVYLVLLTEKALNNSDVIRVANTIVWAPSIESGKIHFKPTI